MTTYSVSQSQMQFVHGEMENITIKLASTLSDLDNEAKQNLQQWTSDARDAYHAAKSKWDAAALQMQAQAKAATVALGTIGEAYARGEQYGVSLWDQ